MCPSSRHCYDHPPSKVAMCSHAKCKSDIYFYSVYCIHLLNENIDLAFGLPNPLFLLMFLSSSRPTPHFVITLGVTLPKSQSHRTILWFSAKTLYSQKWPPLSDSVNSFSMRTGALIGTDNDFMHQRFWFARQVLHYRHRHDYWKLFEKSHPHHAQSHLLPWKSQRNGRVHMSHMRGLRPNQMVVGSLHTYTCTHMSLPADAKEWSVLETIYLNNVCLCRHCPYHQCPRRGVLH